MQKPLDEKTFLLHEMADYSPHMTQMLSFLSRLQSSRDELEQTHAPARARTGPSRRQSDSVSLCLALQV